MVVPNGSGSIINFNNGKLTSAAYSQYIYDIDPMAATYTTIENLDTARLPIFGICREDRSLLVEVEKGAATAVVNAEISGKYNDYNYAYPIFVLRNVDNLRNFGTSSQDVYVLEEEMYDINATVRYTFLNEDYTGYDGLANVHTETAKNAISFLMFIVPPVMIIVSLIIFSKKYKIYGDFKQEVLKAVSEKK